MCMTIAEQSAMTLGSFAVGLVIGAAIVVLAFAARTAVPADGPSRSGRPS